MTYRIDAIELHVDKLTVKLSINMTTTTNNIISRLIITFGMVHFGQHFFDQLKIFCDLQIMTFDLAIILAIFDTICNNIVQTLMVISIYKNTVMKY